jgi:molybdate transport system substrate-binding protein
MTPALLRRSLATALLALTVSVAHAVDLTVSAAASLTNAFRELGLLFEAQNAGTSIVFNFGASDALLAQIARGAPADVFASADQETMDRAQTQKLLAAGSRQNFAANMLVMIVPADSKLGLATPADLQKAKVKRIAVGNPTSVPAGRYTRSVLESARLWAALEPKLVFALNVRQALDYVARGEADAGFVYATDALIMKDKVKLVGNVASSTPITYPIASVAASPNPGAARRFLDFVLTPAAQSVLARHGFGQP